MVIIERIRHRYEPFIGDAQPIAADLTVSTAAELPALGAKIGTLYAAAAGTRADVIHAGMRYTLDADGKWYTSDAYEIKSVSGGEITFTGTGTPLIDYTIRGNCVQDGAPTPTSPVKPVFLGATYATGYVGVSIYSKGEWFTAKLKGDPFAKIGEYADEIRFSEQCVVRYVKKLVLIGDENWKIDSISLGGGKYYNRISLKIGQKFDSMCTNAFICDSYIYTTDILDTNGLYFYGSSGYGCFVIMDERFRANSAGLADFKAFLAQRNSAGNPVTIWYAVKAPEAEHIDLPEIPTVRGENTITVTGGDFDIPPSGIDIVYR